MGGWEGWPGGRVERTTAGAKALGPVLVGLGLQSLVTSLQTLALPLT